MRLAIVLSHPLIYTKWFGNLLQIRHNGPVGRHRTPAFSSPLTKNVLMDHCRLPSSRTWRFLAGPHPTTYCSPPVRHSRSVLLIVRRKTSRPFTKISRTLWHHKIITQITFVVCLFHSARRDANSCLGTLFFVRCWSYHFYLHFRSS